MPIGTSDGQVYEDELHHAVETSPLKITVYKNPPENTEDPKYTNAPLDGITPDEKYDDTPTTMQNVRTNSDPEKPSAQSLKSWENRFETSTPQPSPDEEDLNESNQPKKVENSSPSKLSQLGQALKSDLSRFAGTALEAFKAGPQLMKDVYEGKVDPMSDEGIGRLTDVAANFGIGGLVTAPLRPGVGMFGGRLGLKNVGETIKDVDKSLLHVAPDDKLRFEISDKGSRLKTENLTDVTKDLEASKKSDAPKGRWAAVEGDGKKHYQTPYEKVDWEATKNSKDGWVFTGPKTVGDILHHPELFKYYPDLKNIKLTQAPFGDFLGSIQGFHRHLGEGSESIFVRGGTEEEMKKTLLHELQHAIQTREGHAKGGNVDMFKPSVESRQPVEEGIKALREQLNGPRSTEVVKDTRKLLDRWNEMENVKLEMVREGYQQKMVSIEKFVGYRSDKVYRDSNFVLGNLVHKVMREQPLSKPEQYLYEVLAKKHPEFFEDHKTLYEAKKLLDGVDEQAFRQYERLYGEYEARATAIRNDMSELERSTLPHENSAEFQRTYPEGTVPRESTSIKTKTE